MISIRSAFPNERQRLHDFHIPNHLACSTDAREIANQIKDLPEDFPSLHSDECFALSVFFVAVLEEDKAIEQEQQPIVGVISVSTRNCKDGVYKIECLSVAEKFRTKGVGGRLLSTAIEHCRLIKDCKAIELVTLRGRMDSAIRLYHRAGFLVTASMPSTHVPPEDFEILLMRRTMQ
jgi:ribosomal protein S18 acetylase RimI-like enzyme